MALGPVLKCSPELLDSLPALAAEHKIGLTSSSEDGITDYSFRAFPARIVGHEKNGIIWLVYPFPSHAFNPLVWWFDFRLTRRIVDMLTKRGAQPSNEFPYE